MKTLIVMLAILSFLQSTIIPLDLVLLILICRSFIKTQSSNYYLVFTFGLLNSHLNLTTLGFQSFIYLAVVLIIQILSKSQLANHAFYIIPIVMLGSFFNLQALSVLTNQTPRFFPQIIFEGLVSLPVFYLLRLWEERFIAKNVKLKI